MLAVQEHPVRHTAVATPAVAARNVLFFFFFFVSFQFAAVTQGVSRQWRRSVRDFSSADFLFTFAVLRDGTP